MTTVREFHAANFCIDLAEDVFHGHPQGDTWSGFVCSYFEYNEAVRILNSLGNIWSYDVEQ